MQRQYQEIKMRTCFSPTLAAKNVAKVGHPSSGRWRWGDGARLLLAPLLVFGGLLGGGGLRLTALALHLIHHDAAGDGDIQRADGAHHGNGDQYVALASHQVVQPLAFGAHDEGAIHVVIELVVSLFAALVETDDPDVLRLQLTDAAGDVDPASHGKVLAGASRCLDHGTGDAGGAALGNDHAIDAGAVGGADERAKVVRVLDAIEHQQKAVLAVFVLQQLVDAGVFLARGDGHDTLVGIGAGFAVDVFAGDKADGDALGTAVVQDALQTVIGAISRDGHVVKAASAALQCFADGMDAVDHFAHTYPVYGTGA